MSASVIGAVASSATTALLALVAYWVRKMVRRIGQLKREHEFLMSTTRYNTQIIRLIVQHIELGKIDGI